VIIVGQQEKERETAGGNTGEKRREAERARGEKKGGRAEG